MKKLKVLALTQEDRMPNWDGFYQALGNYVDLDWRKLNKSEQSNLRKYFSNIDVNSYDRIFLELRFKRQLRQRNFIGTLPNLIEYEWDATQNYKLGGKYEGAWSKYYSSLSSLKVICSGYIVTEKLKSEGFDVRFVPKGYNEAEITCLDLERDIELGFIGRVEKDAYDGRKKLLQSCVDELDLKLLRTDPGEAYNRMLNRIQFFVSADHGLDEYMGKNFEALAAGCVLCCYRQGGGEEEALGFKDMENVVLYSDVQELKGKLNQLKGDPELILSISKSGRKLAEREYTSSKIAEKTAMSLSEPMLVSKEISLAQKFLASIGR